MRTAILMSAYIIHSAITAPSETIPVGIAIPSIMVFIMGLTMDHIEFFNNWK